MAVGPNALSQLRGAQVVEFATSRMSCLKLVVLRPEAGTASFWRPTAPHHAGLAKKMRGLAQQYLLFGIWECSHELSRRLDSYYGILPMLTRPLQEIWVMCAIAFSSPSR